MTSALDDLARDYFEANCAAEPVYASTDGVPGYDAELPDPSRAAARAQRDDLARLGGRLDGIDAEGLTGEDRITRDMLARLIRDKRDALDDGITEVGVSATTSGVFSEMVACLPMANVSDPERAEAYLTRLSGLGGYFDALTRRHLDAKADGRFPTALGVRQTIAQLDGYLTGPLGTDPFLRPDPTGAPDPAAWRARAAEIIESAVRPAIARHRTALAEELLPVGRGSGEVGVGNVPGGDVAYRNAARAHTTTDLSPEELHETGLALVAGLREEFAERGGRALGVDDTAEVLHRLREDPALRFTAAAEIVETVTVALRRAEEALPDWFRRYDIAPCVVREMDPAEAAGNVLGYYLAPAADGSRPGAHVVNTHRPDLRTRFEYEVLAFHESVPGHHLQFALSQSLGDLPEFRRFAYVTAHSEGWGLYSERLTEEMGLYTSELSRLGMVSFDAWRACRLVVDTGMHHYGWSRERALAYMRDNTALSEANITNEIDRYIAWPGQALAYMVGRLSIRRARERAEAAMGAGFDLREFHHRVLSHGSVPLDILDGVIDRWSSGRE
ncbi:DUF885 domain-containing protein [Phytomonospora endophytica]|uniref:Uncharacterized protein (DUF885 family) n=1 Tax=Phytomonospora endophytica TaxID=714109 RepID=A0A841FCQ5_9ACTN|nr:DUF885 domain-containing protein [Phytomonospora endophytica]MBB6033574.1 uncharacterized protein (DUF885 family) [Phytomonospora endophytica]GIG64910.1 hypothetical protein Pen01_12050 [Phytomonospora endophytica]